MDLALRELEGSGITLSVDTTRPDVRKRCLRYDIHAVNDIGGLADREYGEIVADSGLPAFLMASYSCSGRSDRHAINIKRSGNRDFQMQDAWH